MGIFKSIRILILLAILCGAYYYVHHQSDLARAWTSPLQVMIYPIAGDDNPATFDYISKLNSATFSPIVDFMQAQSIPYNIYTTPIMQITVGQRLNDLPPMLDPKGANTLDIIWWSLKLRYWAWQHSPDSNNANVRLYLIYYTAQGTPVLDSSLASSKNLVAITKVFADSGQAAQNNIVITHELLHTLGATDKYDLNTLLPLYPQGYANPDQRPITPQTLTEIMAGRMLITQHNAIMPDNLAQCVIGPLTAKEINWRE